MKKTAKKWLGYSILFLLFAISFTTSNDFSQDLGRHLKLGEIIWQTRQIPLINLFSYTNPSFPFINHHWLSEVIFFWLEKSWSTYALILLKVSLIILTGWITIKSSQSKSGTFINLLISLMLLPLLIERMSIRPELFGYVFFSSLLYILFFQQDKRLFYFIPFLMLLWINMHISFVFGLYLLVLFFITKIKIDKKRTALLVLLSVVALCINPNGIRGVLYPFNIFGNYGYSIVENQNMFFLASVLLNPLINYFFLLTPIIFVALIVLLSVKKYTLSLILITFYLLPLWQIRHLPFFVWSAIPIVSFAYSILVQKSKKYFISYEKYKNRIRAVCLFAAFIVALLLMQNTYYRMYDIQRSFGIGINDNMKTATDFILKSKLPPRLFNNFDIGGYAIYRLYPKYKMFVDNRPEAYPVDFLENTYIKMQENEELRKKVFSRYGIHTIFFAHTDMTPWGRTFVNEIVNDPEWTMVFLDSSLIVMTDKEGYRDVRNNKDYINNLIYSEEDYLSLLRISSITSLMKKNDESLRSLNKAYKINPLSCSIRRILYENKSQLPSYFMIRDIGENSWWCF